jgi:hypothetical protein
MNTTRLEELLIAREDGTLNAGELDELKSMLRDHPEARRRLVESDVMGAVASSQAFSENATVSKPSTMRRQVWRPWFAAAAGIVIGCFSTTLVMAWSGGIRQFGLALANIGFEQPQPLPQVHLAPVSAQWAGITTEIVEGGGVRPAARNGQRMMKLGPAPEGKGFFANLMTDLTSSRPLTAKPLQIEVTAWYHASKPGQNEHYSLNVATFGQDAAEVSTLWESTWLDMRDASLTTTGRALFPTAHESGWHSITVRLDVPPQARTLVISMGANTPGPVSGRTDHFMDDVQASWLVLEKPQAVP